MPLPDAKPDRRIYELLKTTDLQSLTFSDFQKVAQTIYAEQGAEDELRRIVLVNLARLSVAGEWTGLTSAGGGTGAGEMPGGSAASPGGNGYIVQYPFSYRNSNVETTSNGVVRFNKQQANFFPFWNYKAGTMDSMTARITAANDDDLMVGLYTTGTDGCPNTIIGTAVEWDMGTSGVITLDLSGVGDWVVEADRQYWLGMMLKTDNTNRPTFYVMENNQGPAYTIPTTSTATEDYFAENAAFYVTNLTAGTLPSTVPVSSPDGLFSSPGTTVPMMTFTLA